MMLRHYFLLLIFLLPIAASAETQSHPVTLWEISGSSNRIYLLGSIHLLREKDYPLPSIIETVYEDAEVLVMEIDMDELDPIRTQSLVQELGLLEGNKTLRDVMGPELYREALETAASIDIPLEMLKKTEPWYAAMTVELLSLSRIGFDPNLGVEMYMVAKAGRDGKRIDGLETIEEQLKFLDGLPLAAQRDMLIAVLQESAEIAEIMDEMIDAWRIGNTRYLEEELLQSFAENEILNDVLLNNRNAKWVTQIKALMHDKDDYLVIVGALHLVGDDGVPRRLAREGIRVQQLSETPTVR